MKKYLYLNIISIVLTTASCTKAVEGIHPVRKDLIELVFASGVLEADGENKLTAQTDGFIVQVNFNEGDEVVPGELLAVIDNHQNLANANSARVLNRIAQENTRPSAPALLQINANLAAATAKFKLDQLQTERYKRLYEAKSVSELEYQNAVLTATTSKASLNALQQQYNSIQVTAKQQAVAQRSAADVNAIIKDQNQVRAIIAGRIYEKQKQLGDYVRKGDVIAVIASQKLLYAKLSVDESNMASLKTGQAIIVKLNTNKHKTYKAVLHEILPAFDSGTQSFIVKAYFTDSLDFRIAGTQLEANIITGTKKFPGHTP
ncbi:efflux RND transporter periplasmic adaptor subunit [Mucilaginibacter antarcticus]|uniref:efflux RND transporter periplasmic adaptor subunit n=1 Tax=Mucilaginibacter antarcticus TaxID=1855725 RepID=UPI00363EBDE5